MSRNFPSTRLTLIQRLASGGQPEDWGRFLKDYWGPVCRFSLRYGARNLDDAEDVAAQTFEVLWANRLLDRWVANRSAKLRALLCGVARKVLATRHRTRARRERLKDEVIEHVEQLQEASQQETDVFYAAWVEDLIRQAVESLAVDYCRKNQGDRIRVLYGRTCEGLTIAEVAETLGIKPSTVDFYFRDARDRLGEELRRRLRPQIERCCPDEEVEAEFDREWQQLGDYLVGHGGLEEALRRTFELLPLGQWQARGQAGIDKAVTRLTAIRRPPQDANGGEEGGKG